MTKKWLLIFLAQLLYINTAVADNHDAMAATSDDYMTSLVTKTPLEGRMLAIKIVRKTIGTIVKDSNTKKKVRRKYEDDPKMLMMAAELVAIEFKTIAKANNYWLGNQHCKKHRPHKKQ